MATNRQTKYTAYTGAYLLIVIGILVAANFLANRYNKSVDLTANKRYSLSDQTEKVVKGLKQDVKVTYFDDASSFPRAKDLLDRYSNLSPKLKVEYIDPNKKPNVARAAGVKTLGVTFIEANGKREEAKSPTEEELTGALIRTMKDGERNVCFVQGANEHSIGEANASGYSQFKELLENANYKVREISLGAAPSAGNQKIAVGTAVAPAVASATAAIPKDCTVTVVGGPRFDYPQPAVDALKASVEDGGRVLFLLDPPLKLGSEHIADNNLLVAQLANWGVTLNKDLVLDLSGIGQIFGLSEAVPLITAYESHPIVREMKKTAVGMPLVRSLTAEGKDKTTVDTLFSTSDNSFATKNLSAAEIRPDPTKDEKGPLAVAAAGTYQSATGQGRFIVTGSSGWVANNILRFNGNRDLALNMMNWLSSDEDLISIRPKDPEDRRLTMTSSQMMMVRAVSQFVIPLIVIVGGLLVWLKRR